MNAQNEMSETDTIVNRHMARLLCKLEEAGCPDIFRDAVKSELVWLRDDLKEMHNAVDTRAGNR
jgi:hypothetical protein